MISLVFPGVYISNFDLMNLFILFYLRTRKKLFNYAPSDIIELFNWLHCLKEKKIINE